MNESAFKIIPYENKFATPTVNMWRLSKERAIGQAEKHSVEDHINFLENFLSTNYIVLLVLESAQDRVVGMIAFNNEEISQLYIHPDYQGKGIGTRLLRIAQEKSMGRLWLFTFEINQSAQGFYEKHHFRIIGRGRENEENLPDIKYEWTKVSLCK